MASSRHHGRTGLVDMRKNANLLACFWTDFPFISGDVHTGPRTKDCSIQSKSETKLKRCFVDFRILCGTVTVIGKLLLKKYVRPMTP
ncbi:hypothetical protein B566_EDAN002101, partial [Ephemera danica]